MLRHLFSIASVVSFLLLASFVATCLCIHGQICEFDRQSGDMRWFFSWHDDQLRIETLTYPAAEVAKGTVVPKTPPTSVYETWNRPVTLQKSLGIERGSGNFKSVADDATYFGAIPGEVTWSAMRISNVYVIVLLGLLPLAWVISRMRGGRSRPRKGDTESADDAAGV